MAHGGKEWSERKELFALSPAATIVSSAVTFTHWDRTSTTRRSRLTSAVSLSWGKEGTKEYL